MTPKSHIPAEKPLVCRPDVGLWFPIGLWDVFGLGVFIAVVFFPQRPTAAGEFWGFVGVIIVLFALPTLLGAWWMRGHGIIADARGLTFFGFHRRRFVAWHEVEDFEFRLPNSNQTKLNQPPAYLLSGGKWRHLSQVLSYHDALLETIAREATSAKAPSWQLGETRDDGEWPKTYEYRDVSGWRFAGLYLLWSFLLSFRLWSDVLFKGFGPIMTSVSQIWSFLSPWGRAGFVSMLVLMCGSYPLIFVTPYFATRTRRSYLGQKIVATREGISLFRNSRQTAMRWDEITSYHLEMLPGNFQPDLCVICAPDKRIEFVTGIENTKPLQELVKTRAQNATTTKWLHQHGLDDDVLGGAASLYRGAAVGEGPKTHHYRTRSNRAMLFFLAILIGTVLVRSLIGITHKAAGVTPRDIAFFVFFSVLLGGGPLIAVAGYFRSWLRCEDDGLHQNSIWGESFLRWDEIEKLRFNDSYTIVSGKKRKIRFGLVADCEGLWVEIEKRSGVERKRDGNAF